jgi:hypothetical protein
VRVLRALASSLALSPPRTRVVAAQRALGSDHLIEGYTARYLSAENDGVTVTAVRFDGETLAAAAIVEFVQKLRWLPLRSVRS